MEDPGRKNEQGVALVVTLLFLAALGVLASALVFTVQTEMNTSSAYKHAQQALYVANAGVQKGVLWFNNSYSPHLPSSDYDATKLPVEYTGAGVLLAGQTGSSAVYPDGTVTAAFSAQFRNQPLQAGAGNSGVYVLNATLLKHTPVTFLDPATFTSYPSAIERWRLNGLGYWGSAANPMGIAQITAVIENSGNAMFDRALWGIHSVSLSGHVLIDSYDSGLGPYGGTNVGDEGAIGSNGWVSANGNVTIDGDLAYGPSGSYSESGSVSVTGDIIQLQQPHYFPPLPSFAAGTTEVNVTHHHPATITPGSYGTVSTNDALTLTPGIYYIDQLTEGSHGQLIITGPTTIFVKSALDLSGQGVANPSGNPDNLDIYYAGTSELDMTGGTGFYGEVYAPNATLKMVGNSDFYGSFIALDVRNSGTPSIHYDEKALKQNLVQHPFRLITWSQDAY